MRHIFKKIGFSIIVFSGFQSFSQQIVDYSTYKDKPYKLLSTIEKESLKHVLEIITTGDPKDLNTSPNWGQIDKWLTQGMNPNIKISTDKKTLLHVIVQKGDVTWTKKLLGLGADPNATTTNKETPIFWVSTNISANDVALYDLLISKGATINSHNSNDENPLSYLLARYTPLNDDGYMRNINHLIERGVNINSKNKFKASPLIIASYSGNKGATILLINKGADVNFNNSEWKTPLHWARENEWPDVVQLLILKGAK